LIHAAIGISSSGDVESREMLDRRRVGEPGERAAQRFRHAGMRPGEAAHATCRSR
jgi:hypothetical protein